MTSTTIQIAMEDALLAGDVVVPAQARGVVMFAHGSGSSRHSPRNRWVAQEIQKAGQATLLLDLLTQAEELADARDRLVFHTPQAQLGVSAVNQASKKVPYGIVF